MKIQQFSVSHKGRRDKNEDSVLIHINKRYSSMQAVIAVADGLGGYHRGDLASQLMIRQLKKLNKKAFTQTANEFYEVIEKNIIEANHQIFNKGKKLNHGQSGTTVSGAVLKETSCLFFNVGDSRTYVIKANSIRQVTQDHSADMESFKNGLITQNEIGQGHYSHALTRSIGTDPEVDVDIFPGRTSFHTLEEGDIILSCTDGLWNEVTEREIFQEIIGRKTLKQSLESLVSLAYMKNSQDNISIAALEYGRLPRKNLNLQKYVPINKMVRRTHRKNLILF